MGKTIPGYWSHIAAAITFSSLVHVVLPDKLFFSKEMKAYAAFFRSSFSSNP